MDASLGARRNRFLTPGEPTGTRIIAIRVPDNMTRFVWGALSELCDPEKWEQFETLTPDEVAQIFTDLTENEVSGMGIVELPAGGLPGQVPVLESIDPVVWGWHYVLTDPQDGMPITENSFYLKNYTIWGNLLVAPFDRGGVLTDGGRGILESYDGTCVGLSNQTESHVIVIDLETDVIGRRFTAFGIKDESAGYPAPAGWIVQRSTDNVTWDFVAMGTWTVFEPDPSLYWMDYKIPWTETGYRYWMLISQPESQSGATLLSELELIAITG